MATRDEEGATAVRYSYSSFIWLQIGIGLLGNGEAKQQSFFLLPEDPTLVFPEKGFDLDQKT